MRSLSDFERAMIDRAHRITFHEERVPPMVDGTPICVGSGISHMRALAEASVLGALKSDWGLLSAPPSLFKRLVNATEDDLIDAIVKPRAWSDALAGEAHRR